MALDADAARLAKGTNLATVVTLMPDGQPQAQLTWVDHDGEHILVNTEPVRQRTRNLRRDPRVTVLIHSSEQAYDWAEIRGHVVETPLKVAGGMNGILLDHETGMMQGAACWRADGAPMGFSGGDGRVDDDAAKAMWK